MWPVEEAEIGFRPFAPPFDLPIYPCAEWILTFVRMTISN